MDNCSLEKTEMSAHQWRKAQESLVSLERNNVASVDSIVRFDLRKPFLFFSSSVICLKSLITSISQQRWHGCQWEPTLSILDRCFILSWCFWCCK